MKKPLGRKVAILGLGKSGYASAFFLKEKGFQLFASDQAASDMVLEYARRLRQEGIEVETGQHSKEKILACDWVLISPGIPPTALIYEECVKRKIPIRSEIEVASWYCPSSRIIGVTGSAGKTTVTTLISRVLEKATGKAFCCGNIGNPWIGELGKIKPGDFVVLELSSFQLAQCERFHPEIGILLNIAPNHQDWHRDMPEYVGAKLRLFTNQTSRDAALIRKKDEERYFPNRLWKSNVSYFGEDPSLNPNEEVVRLTARLLDCPESTVNEVLSTFEGIPHRLEKIGTSEGVDYINDSKCTTTASLTWALEKFQDQKVVLLAGGHPKSVDFDQVRSLVKQKVKLAILIGEARPLLRKAWEGAAPIQESSTFREAVHKAREGAVRGDVVLLSPACASFDMFKNYEERGALFKKIVLELIGASTAHV